MNGLMRVLADDAANRALLEKLRANPDKVYFPNFGSGGNILKNGFNVNRVFFKIPGLGIEIYWYGFLIAIGILLAMLYGYRKMRSCGIDPDRATDAVIGGLVGAIAGARLYYIIFNDEMKISQFFNIRDGGLAIYGGIIGAIVVGGIIVKIRKLKLTTMLDICGPCFLIGQCIGRWGNFFNQEAFGSNTKLPWGMQSMTTMQYISDHYDDLGGQVSSYLPVHPCFLYESLWCLLGFIILHLYFKHRKFDGEVFLMYAGWYGLGRFFIEGLRTDSLYLGNIRVSQLLAGACVLISVILIVIFRSVVKRNPDYKFFYQTELSKAQLAQYESYEKNKAEKKELKAKIRKAKEDGESFVELEKEYEEKFGKGAEKKRIEEALKKDKEIAESGSDEKYSSILADDDEPKPESKPEAAEQKADEPETRPEPVKAPEPEKEPEPEKAPEKQPEKKPEPDKAADVKAEEPEQEKTSPAKQTGTSQKPAQNKEPAQNKKPQQKNNNNRNNNNNKNPSQNKNGNQNRPNNQNRNQANRNTNRNKKKHK